MPRHSQVKSLYRPKMVEKEAGLADMIIFFIIAIVALITAGLLS